MEDKVWIFTFGGDHEHGGHYVKFTGTFDEARAKMVAAYGSHWCSQYSEKEWESMKNDPNRWWPMETELQ